MVLFEDIDGLELSPYRTAGELHVFGGTHLGAPIDGDAVFPFNLLSCPFIAGDQVGQTHGLGIAGAELAGHLQGGLPGDQAENLAE
jgi:hypothetical protein